MRISLIGTVHEECGAVTVLALLKILKRIQPEVVFAEVPRTDIDAWQNGSHGSVESIAVARYAETHSIEVVAVDLPKPDESFFQDWKEVTRSIERTSPAFRRLMDINAERARQGGFTYINSDESVQAWTDIYREELETVDYIGSSRLREIYSRKCDLMERRDLAMLQASVFLVGTAHRKSLIEKIRTTKETASPRVGWDLCGAQVRSD